VPTTCPEGSDSRAERLPLRCQGHVDLLAQDAHCEEVVPAGSEAMSPPHSTVVVAVGRQDPTPGARVVVVKSRSVATGSRGGGGRFDPSRRQQTTTLGDTVLQHQLAELRQISGRGGEPAFQVLEPARVVAVDHDARRVFHPQRIPDSLLQQFGDRLAGGTLEDQRKQARMPIVVVEESADGIDDRET
jgi:hypothetical protein